MDTINIPSTQLWPWHIHEMENKVSPEYILTLQTNMLVEGERSRLTINYNTYNKET